MIVIFDGIRVILLRRIGQTPLIEYLRRFGVDHNRLVEIGDRLGQVVLPDVG